MPITEIKRHGYNTQLHYSSDGTTYTKVTDLAKIDIGADLTNLPDATDLESTDGYREKAPGQGWQDTEPWEGEIYLKETQYAALLVIKQAKTEYYFKVKFPLATGQVTASEAKMPKGCITQLKFLEVDRGSDELIRYSIRLERTQGKPVFTPGT